MKMFQNGTLDKDCFVCQARQFGARFHKPHPDHAEEVLIAKAIHKAILAGEVEGELSTYVKAQDKPVALHAILQGLQFS